MTITTDMLERVGCVFDGIYAYDITDKYCVAIERRKGEWQIWRPENWRVYPRRFRVKVKGV